MARPLTMRVATVTFPWLLLTIGLAGGQTATGVAGLPAQESKKAAEETGPDLEGRFYAEYPAAVERQKAALRQLRGEGTYRHRTTTRRDAPYVRLTFYIDGDNLRYHHKRQVPAERGPSGQRNAEEAYLFAPNISAVVKDPGSPYAFVEQSGADLRERLAFPMSIWLWRFLKSTYCHDGRPFLDKITEKIWTIREIGKDPGHPEWVRVELAFREENRQQPQFTATGTVSISFAPSEDWSARECHYDSGPPYNQKFDVYLDELFALPGGGYIPKSLRCIGHKGPFTEQSASARDKDDRWSEYVEYRLGSAQQAPTPPAEFTLAALGVGKVPNATPSGYRLGLVTCSFAVLVALMAWRYARRAKAAST